MVDSEKRQTMHPLEAKIEKAWPVHRWRDAKIVVAVSGGADSVCLLTALGNLASKPEDSLVVAHFNHRWRGEESDADAAFVTQLATKMGLNVEVGQSEASQVAKLHSEVSSKGNSREGQARDERYDFLFETTRNVGARYLVTAHTVDDQIETILFRILRGTGITGLRGIPKCSEVDGISLIRPMLEISRDEVKKYLKQFNIDFRSDSSNQDLSFSRNRIRKKLIPLLESEFQFSPDSLNRLAIQANEIEEFVDGEVEPLMDFVTFENKSVVRVESSKFKSTHAHIIRALFRRIWKNQKWPLRNMSFEKWNELQQLLSCSQKASVLNLPGAVRVELSANGQLTLSRPISAD